MDIARRHGLPVIEDCSQAHLAEYKGKLVGTIGDMGCFSLGGKPLTAAGGGILITDNEELARRAKGFAAKGSEYDEELRNSLRPTSSRPRLRTRILLPGRLPPDERPDGRHRHSPSSTASTATSPAASGRRHHRGHTVGGAGVDPQELRPGDKSGYYNHGFLYDEEVIGVPPERFVDAVIAEGVNCKVYLGGMPLYHYPVFAESRTYGESGYPFVDERGNRRSTTRRATARGGGRAATYAQGRRQQLAHRAGRVGHRQRHQEGRAALRLTAVMIYHRGPRRSHPWSIVRSA